jgi:CubicO group peptidase (beta-lactamase class C family)
VNPIRKFAATNIFEPLGMNHTQFYDDNTNIIKNRAFSYAKDETKKIGFDNLIMRFDLVGSGGVYSTIEDLYLWDQNFYHNKLGKGGQAIITKMHQDGILNDGKSAGYAFALENGTYKGLKTVSHSGALAGISAQLVRFPEQQFSVIILANRDDADPIRKSYQVADVFLKDKLIEPESKNRSRKSEPVQRQRLRLKISMLRIMQVAFTVKSWMLRILFMSKIKC